MSTSERSGGRWGRPRTRRNLIGALGAAALLSGCVAQPDRRGPVVPTPTLTGQTAAPTDALGEAQRWSGQTVRVALPNDANRGVIDAVLLQPFAQATGSRVDVLVTDYTQLSSSAAAGHPYADLMLVDDRWAVLLDRAGILQAMPATGHDGTTPDLMPVTRTSVPAYAEAIVSLYHNDAFDLASIPQQWSSWWDRTRYPGSRTLQKGGFGTLEIALLADGKRLDNLYPLDLPRAIDSLRRISGGIVDRWWETDPQVIAWLSTGRAVLGSAVASQAVVASWTGHPVTPVWNQGLLYSDAWVQPARATNADIASDLVQFMLMASSQATLAQVGALAPVSFATFAHIDPLVAQNLATAPVNLSRLARVDSVWWADNAVAANQAFNGWLLGNPVPTI